MKYCRSMWKWAALGVAAWLSLASGAVALSPTWSYFYNGPANDVDISSVIIRGSDGNLYVAGASRSRAGDPSSYDLVVLSVTTDGTVRWVYRYNGPADLEDGAYDMIEGPDGNLYGTGITTVDGIDYDLMVFSLTKSGQLRWLYTYDGTAHGHDVGDAIVADDAGNLYVAGMSSRTGLNDNYDWIVLSLTSNGTLRWFDRYNGPGNYHDRAYDIAYGSDGNLYVAGYRVTSGNFADFMVAKYTTGGSRLWIRTQNPSGYHDMAYAVTFGADGNVYAAGRLEIATGWEFAVVSYDPSGNLRWVYTNPNTYGEAYALTYGQTDLYVAGLTQNSRFTVVSLNPSDGSEAWVYQYAPANNEYGRATGILQNSDGSLYAYGGVRLTNDYGSRPTVVKLTRTGSPIFEERFPYFLIYTNKPKEYIDLANLDYPTFYLTAGVSGNGTTQDISFGIEEWEQYGHVQTYDATNESTDHDIWVARFDEISVTLLWPNQPGIVLEEGDTTYVRFDGIAGHGIAYVESRFSPDGGRTWPYYIGSVNYNPPQTIADDDSIRWIVDVPATDSGRVKATLYDTQNDSVFDISAYDIQVKLARPGNLQAQATSPWTSVTLTWEDRSNHNTGYEIRRIDEAQDTVYYTISDPNATSFTDNTVEPFHTYLYQIRSTDGTHTSDWVDVYVFNTPHWAVTDSVRWVRTAWAGDWLYVFYAKPSAPGNASSRISYRYSTDMGYTFSQEYTLTSQTAMYPAKFEVAGERYGHRVGVAYLTSSPQHGAPVSAYVTVVEGATIGNEIFVHTFQTADLGDIGIFWKPETDTLLLAILTDDGPQSSAFWAVDAVTGGVYDYGWGFGPFSIGEEGVIQDRIFQGIYGQTYGLTFSVNPNTSNEAIHTEWLYNTGEGMGPGGTVYLVSQSTQDLASSQTLAAFKDGDTLKVYYYYLNSSDLYVYWTSPRPTYTYATSQDAPVDVEAVKKGYDEFLTVLDGTSLKLLRREQLGSRYTWNVKETLNLLSPEGLLDLDLWQPRVTTPSGSNLYVATAYTVTSDRQVLVMKRRTYTPLVPIAAEPAQTDLPAYGQVRTIRWNGQTHLIWQQEGMIWHAWTNDPAEHWTSPEPVAPGWAPTVALHPDGTGFTIFYLHGKPGSDTLMAVPYTASGFGTPSAVWIPPSQTITGPVAATLDAQGHIALAFLQQSGTLYGDTLFIATSQSLRSVELSETGTLLQDLTFWSTNKASHPDTLTPWEARLTQPSPALLAVGSNLYVLETQPDQVTLHTFANGSWQTQILSQNQGPYRSPHIASDGKTVYFLWSQGSPGDIFYRFSYPDDPSFLSKAMNLSNTPDADSKDPWIAGQRLFWAEQQSDGTYAIFHTSMAKPTTPEALSQTPWGTASLPQTVSYTVGGSYYQTTVYVTTWLQEEVGTHQTALLWEVYSTGPIPEQVLTLGDTLPTPYTTQRDTFAQYGTQKGQSADVGNALSYQITDLDPQKSYTLGFYIYHEESTDVIERFYADGQPLKIVSSTPGTETYVEVSIPLDLYQNDSTIVVSVTKESGPTAILNEIYVFGTPLPSGGPMASESHVAMPRAFAIEWIRPLPLRGTGQVLLAIPRVATVSLDLYDITGRRVRRFYHGTLEPGYHTLTLRPEDDRGNRLASGVYFLRLKTPEVVKIRKVVWMP